jgi:hypothetical protein
MSHRRAASLPTPRPHVALLIETSLVDLAADSDGTLGAVSRTGYRTRVRVLGQRWCKGSSRRDHSERAYCAAVSCTISAESKYDER